MECLESANIAFFLEIKKTCIFSSCGFSVLYDMEGGNSRYVFATNCSPRVILIYNINCN